MNEHLEPKDCPTCGAEKTLCSKEPGAWPAFYESDEARDAPKVGPNGVPLVGPSGISWIGPGGSIVNGGGLPTYSADRLTFWFTPGGGVSRWVAPAPMPRCGPGVYPDYNTVIGDFLRSRRA